MADSLSAKKSMVPARRILVGSPYVVLDELITRVLCDTAPPGAVDAAYLFAQTRDSQESVLKAGLFLYGMGPARKLALSDLKAQAGYPGFAAWRRRLVSSGVPTRDIVPVSSAPEFPPSTAAEALGLVRLAKKLGWRTLYVVASPLHQLRAFMTVVSYLMAEAPNLAAYSFHGIAQRWEEHIVHSQGIQQGVRSELLGAELEKIEKYYQKGDVVSAREVLKYLDKRDKS